MRTAGILGQRALEFGQHQPRLHRRLIECRYNLRQIVALELPLEQNFLVIGAFGIIGSIALAFIRHGGPASVGPQEAARELRPSQQTPQNA